MSAPDWEKLRAPFAPDEIEKKPQGKVLLDYVGHAGITTRLNEVAGPDQWDWQPLATNEDGTPKFSDGGMWITLTIWGTSKIGFGDPGRSEGANGVKEIIGDALRNAAMRFGIGTYLWSKSERAMAAKSGELEPEPEPVANPRDLAVELIGRLSPESDAADRRHAAEVAMGKPISEASMDDWQRVLEKWQRDGVDIVQHGENVPLPEQDPEDEPVPAGVMITAPQNRALHAALTRMGIKGGAVHEWLSQELGTTVTSAKEVTAEEASFLLDKLKQAGA